MWLGTCSNTGLKTVQLRPAWRRKRCFNVAEELGLWAELSEELEANPKTQGWASVLALPTPVGWDGCRGHPSGALPTGGSSEEVSCWCPDPELGSVAVTAIQIVANFTIF